MSKIFRSDTVALSRSRRAGLLVIAALALTTLGGHFVVRGSGATPMLPPPAGGGIDFASPGGSPVKFSGTLDRQAVLLGGDRQVKMELVLAAEERSGLHPARTPTDFVLVLDRSGSMDGVKIEHARAAVRELISQLAPEDRFALVSYSSGAELTIPLAPATPEVRQRWHSIVSGIRPGGGTNISGGLDLALGLSGGERSLRARRLMLISDGLANEGDPTIHGLSSRAHLAAGLEIVVSTIGVGADFNEFLMSAVADAGTGNYYYLNDVERMAQVFAAEFEATRETVATALAVRIVPGDGVRVIDAAGYPLEQSGDATVFRPGSLFSGQERRIWVTLEVPNGSPGERDLGAFTASYRHGGADRVLEFTDIPTIACVADQEQYYSSFDKDRWARSVSVEDYNRLQQSVASHVREGRREEAMKEIGEFEAHNSQLNEVMQRQEITRKLEQLQELRGEVDDAFDGADQLSKRKQLSKSRQAAGLDGRRAGSKRLQTRSQGGSR
ncbi:MAG: VWA domain-containing protein [bacterium]|nr:VWA domain-containing protein [bacterium]